MELFIIVMVRCSVFTGLVVVSLVSRASFSRWLPRLVVLLHGCRGTVHANGNIGLTGVITVISAFSYILTSEGIKQLEV